MQQYCPLLKQDFFDDRKGIVDDDPEACSCFPFAIKLTMTPTNAYADGTNSIFDDE
jgi:hypothetical protein